MLLSVAKCRKLATEARLENEGYWALPALLVLAFQFRMLYHWFHQWPLYGGDRVFHLFAGYAWAQNGRVPYADLWNVRPPGMHELTALLALLSGGNQEVLFALTTILSIALTAGIVGGAGYYMRHLTGLPFAGFTVGVLLALYLPLWKDSVSGPRLRLVMLGCLILSLELFRRRRAFWSGLTSTLGALFYLGGAGLPFVILFGWWRRSRQDDGDDQCHWRALLGAMVATVIILFPIAITGAFIPMIIQVVVAPLAVAGEQRGIWSVLKLLNGNLQPYVSLVYVGSVALGIRLWQSLRHDRPLSGYWVLIGFALWFVFRVAYVEFDGPRDALGLVVVFILLIGMIFTALPSDVENIGTWISPSHLLAVVLVLSVVTGLPWAAGDEPEFGGRGTALVAVYNEGDIDTGCHTNLWDDEIRWKATFPWGEWTADSDLDVDCFGADPVEDYKFLRERCDQSKLFSNGRLLTADCNGDVVELFSHRGGESSGVVSAGL